MPRIHLSCRAVVVMTFILTLPLGMQAQLWIDWIDPGEVNATAAAAPANAKASLRALVEAGRIDDLRWPDFSDYRDDLDEFYSRSDYAPAWLHDGQPTPQALQMIDILQDAGSEGLRAEDYDSGRWTDRLTRLQAQHSPSDELRFDAALTVCAMRYVSDLRVGRVNPQYFRFGLAGPKELDLPTFVRRRLAEGTDLKSQVAAVEPPFAGYAELRKALATYTRLAEEDDAEKLPMPPGSGYPGPPYPGFIRLTRLLRRLGDLPENYSVAAASSEAYDPALLQGVRHFQERHGLPATGYLDAQTVEQLNVPLSYRVEQIRLALERYRWLRYDFPQPPVVINIPGSRLYAFDGKGKIALSMTVDVGDDFETTRTPVLEDNLEYLVFRPYWYVPLDIQKEEIVQAIAEDPNYLPKFHFEVVAPSGQVVTSGRVSKNVLQQLAAGRLRMRQRPGPDNAMGLVKFIFPNRYSVYLHDIPAREFFFNLPKRVVSHGCVHVEKPAELAAWVLHDQPGWTLQRVQQAMRNGQNDVRVNLAKPLPVLMLYSTVAAAENGQIYFYRDIYGYDADLLRVLAQGYPYPHETKVSAKGN